jgi:hypothetical protein
MNSVGRGPIKESNLGTLEDRLEMEKKMVIEWLKKKKGRGQLYMFS